MKTKHKTDRNHSELEILPLTDKQLRSMRRVTPEEHKKFCKALEGTFHRPFPPRIGRPPKRPEEKYRPVYIKMHPRVMTWARTEAKRRGTGYQTVINETLLHHTA